MIYLKNIVTVLYIGKKIVDVVFRLRDEQCFFPSSDPMRFEWYFIRIKFHILHINQVIINERT